MSTFKRKLNSFFLLDDEEEIVGAPQPVKEEREPQLQQTVSQAPAVEKKNLKTEKRLPRKSGGECSRVCIQSGRTVTQRIAVLFGLFDCTWLLRYQGIF